MVVAACEQFPWLAPVFVVLPFAFCIGLLAVVILCERLRGFAQFVKYGAIGVIATYVQTVVFYVLGTTLFSCLGPTDWAVQYLGLPSVVLSDGVRAIRFAVATALGFTLANIVCWLMNRWCVFQSGKFKWYVEFGMFYLAALIATLLALGICTALIRWCGMMTTIAVAVEVVVSFLINFFVRKFFIFKG